MPVHPTIHAHRLHSQYVNNPLPPIPSPSPSPSPIPSPIPSTILSSIPIPIMILRPPLITTRICCSYITFVPSHPIVPSPLVLSLYVLSLCDVTMRCPNELSPCASQRAVPCVVPMCCHHVLYSVTFLHLNPGSSAIPSPNPSPGAGHGAGQCVLILAYRTLHTLILSGTVPLGTPSTPPHAHPERHRAPGHTCSSTRSS